MMRLKWHHKNVYLCFTQQPSSVRSAGENAAEDCGELYEK